ncbi:MAG: molybdopterin-binding protein [Pseudorhodoplanes sp.]
MSRHCPPLRASVKFCALDRRFAERQKHIMVPDHHSPQRITRLASLTDVTAWIGANVRAVARADTDSARAIGHVLAKDIAASHAMPRKTISLRDGYALQSDWTSDASSYAPAPLPQNPVRVDAGDELPSGMDCVAALEHIAINGKRAEALAVVAPGDGVLPAGGDAGTNQPLLRAGQKLRASDMAILRVAAITSVSIRAPRISVVRAGRADDPIIASAAGMMAAAIVADGGVVLDDHNTLEAAMQHKDVDAVIAIGGTGAGKNDSSVTTLSRAGSVAFHGIGLNPGETAAIGVAGGKPVLLIPGRIDAALSCWLVLGRHILAQLSGAVADDVTSPLKLARKITSTIGIADVVLLKQRGGEAEPLASGFWPMQAMTQADHYVVVPPDSEGFPAGAIVNVRPLP